LPMASKSGGTSQVVGYRYYMSIHMGVSRGPVNELVAIKVGDILAWNGAIDPPGQVLDNVIFDINKPDLFGGDDKEGGIKGTLAVLMGAADQTVPTIINDHLPGLRPAWRGVTSLFYYGRVTSNNPYPKPWKMRVRRYTAGWDRNEPWNIDTCRILMGPDSDIHAMNPAHIIYECATNRAWGRGLPAALIDDSAFTAAADILFDEGFGLCLRWNREDDIDKFVQTVINHIGGVIYIDRTTGLLTLKLIRKDYTVEALPLFDFNSGLLDISEDQSSATDTSFNEVVVTYHDPLTDEDGQVRVQDLASIQSLGVTISTSVEYPGCPTADLALRLAQRDVEMQSRELRRLTVKLDRAAWAIPPGGAFRISAHSRGIHELVLRAGRIDEASDGSITITAVEDVFSLDVASFVSVEPSAWIPPDRTAHVVDVRRIEEMTYKDLAENLTAANLATVQPDSGSIKVFAQPPNSDSQDYVIASKVGAEDWVERGINSWDPVYELVDPIGYYDTGLSITAITSLFDIASEIEVGSAVLIDDEYMRVDAIDTEAGTATVARGVADTLPAPHDASVVVWFETAMPAGDGREYASGETVFVKLLTRTSTDKLPMDDAPIDDIDIGGRQGRPYPPGNFQINGTPFADVTTGTAAGADIVFTWAHRDRITQGNFLLEHEAVSTGPEAGTTYTIRVYNGVTLLRTVAGISADTWTYTNAMFATDGSISRLTFELESVRDIYVSWQKYRWTLFVGDITLEPELFTETDTFFVPVVARGATHLLPGLFTETDTFYAPDLVARRLYPSLFGESDTFYPPTVTMGVATLSPELLTEADVFLPWTIAHELLVLLPGLVTEDDTFYGPTASMGSAYLLPGLIADTDTIYNPITSSSGTLLAGLVTEDDTFYAPTVVPGTITLLPGLVTEDDTFYGPTFFQPITLIAHVVAQTTGGSNVTSSAIDTTGATLLVMVTCDNGDNTAISDSKGNTWSHLTLQDSGSGGGRTQLHYVVSPTVGSGHTFTHNTSGHFPALAVAAFSNGGIFDAENGNKTASATTLQPNSVTPTQDNELIIFGLGDARTTTASVNVGTITDQLALAPGVAFAIALAYEVQTAATARNPTWTWTTAAREQAVIATFKHN
jgi:hypothetical protein